MFQNFDSDFFRARMHWHRRHRGRIGFCWIMRIIQMISWRTDVVVLLLYHHFVTDGRISSFDDRCRGMNRRLYRTYGDFFVKIVA